MLDKANQLPLPPSSLRTFVLVKICLQIPERLERIDESIKALCVCLRRKQLHLCPSVASLQVNATLFFF